MTHERLQSDEVATALAKEAVSEAVSELVGGKGTNTGPTTNTFDHPPQRLLAGGLLRVFPLPLAPMLRNPLLNLHDKDMVVEFGRKLAEENT